MKCEMPLFFGVSRRAPVPIQTPMLTDLTWGTVSVITRMPFGKDVRLTSRGFDTGDAIWYEKAGNKSYSIKRETRVTQSTSVRAYE
jgi:hypothetical protein